MAAALAAHQLPLCPAPFTAFMLDVHNQLGILSKGYQSNTLVIFDISKNLNRTLRALEKLKKEEMADPRKVRVRELAPGTCEGGHLGRLLCRRRMRNEVLAKECDMERAGGHNMVHGGRARGNFRVAERSTGRVLRGHIEVLRRAVELLRQARSCLNNS